MESHEIRIRAQSVAAHLLPVFDGHEAGELGDDGVLLAGVDDE